MHEVIDSIRDKNPAALSSIADNWLLCAFAERDPAAARKALIALGENPPSLGPIVDVRFNRPFMEGIIATYSEGRCSSPGRFHGCTRGARENCPGPTQLRSGIVRAWFDRCRSWTQRGRTARRPRAVELCTGGKRCNPGRRNDQVFGDDCCMGWRQDLACEQLAIAIRRPGRSQLWPIETDAVLGSAAWRSSV